MGYPSNKVGDRKEKREKEKEKSESEAIRVEPLQQSCNLIKDSN